jgi:hypothetical protein
LVESFVDAAHFIGTSYRAANWLDIGKTQGRGRQVCFLSLPSLKPSNLNLLVTVQAARSYDVNLTRANFQPMFLLVISIFL